MMAQNIPTFVLRFACLHGGVKASAVTRHICPELRMDVEEAQGILDVLVDEGFLSSPGRTECTASRRPGARSSRTSG